MENNKRNTKSKRYFKPARNKKENESKTSYFFNDSKSIGASLNDQSTESQWQPNQTNPKPKDSEKRPQKIQVLDLCEIVSLLEKTPEEIVLEMSNPKFSFDSYINDPMSIYSVNDNYIQKLLFLVGKALTCNSLKLKLGRLMTSFIESDFFTKLVYKQLESNETAVSNAALAPPTRRITGIFAPMEPESPPKELYSEMFVKSVMNVCAQIIDLDPYLKTSLDPFLDRLELIVKYKSNNYSLMEVYENILITSILKAMRKVELEKYRIFKDIEKYDPPEDFTELSIIPTLEEILSDQMPFLRKNVVSGAYQSVNHYLDVHFRLLREDFIQPLREGIIRFREIVNEAKSNRLDATMVRKLKQIDSLNVYMNVTIVSSVLSENGVVYMIKLNLKNNKLINWQNSKRLIYGSLVCLSSDYFTNECFIGIVCVRDVEMLKNAGEIMVKFDFNEFGGNLERLPKFDRSYSMLETSAYFESYRHVLRALQAFGHQNDCDFPFYDELVFMSSEVANESKAPYYLKNSRVDFRPLVDRSNNQPMIEGASGSLLEETWSMKNYDDFKYESLLYAKMCFFNNPDTWPSREQMNLDCSQYEAFKHALQNKLAVIQGPPGTGKTFIGVKLVQFLIQNSQLWWKKDKSRPILMICYTNHALDQFLESCIKMCGLNTGVVRVGGRCKNPSLEKFLLSNLRAQFRQERAYDWRMHTQMNECKQELNNMMELIESKIYQLESLSTLKTSQILKFEYLSSAMDLRQTDELYKKSEEKSSSNNESPDSVLLRWLGFFDITNGSFMNNKPNPATQNNPQTTDQYASIISRLFEERENNKNNRNKKQSDEKDENEEDEEEEEAENEERILEAFDSNKAIKAKLEANKNKKKDNSDKMFLSKFDIVKMFSQFNKGDNNNNDYKKVENNNQKYNKEMKFVESYLKSLLVQTEPFSELDVQGIIRSGLSIWQLNFTDRFRLYQYWLAKYESQILGVLKTLNREFNQQANIMLELRMQMDKSIMEKAMIIAMTTTGSSRYNEILKDIGPRIVIVEEAAEVFESHIVSSLSKHCQHLILIGDHVQLRPKPTVYKLATQFSLDVSLFERLVRNGFKSVMLDCQHRMRPQISMLAKLFYNHPIYDHELVEEYPNVVGMKKNVFFINHKEPESELLDLKSKRNRFEASFLGKLCQYLLKQDYEPSQITVITMYLGQLIEIRNELRRIGISKIRVSTVDNFQGEESDIVLLSLVRSNLRRRIGFLNTSNRICVALSRAKHGLYCIGNLDMLAEANFEWSEVLRTAQRNNLLGSELVLTCGQHPQNDIYVQRPLDFERRPDGGCQLMCGSRLRCGHMCQLHCHAVDRDHVKYKCTKPCSKIIPWCGHYCQQQCSHPGECSECTFLVKKTVRLCGHEIDFRCDREPERWDCQAQCERRVESCGHRCQRKCSDLDCDKCLVEVSYDPICVHKQQKIKTYCYEPFWVVQEKCTKTCGQELHACGHICSSTCGSCFGGRIHQGCREKCNRILFCGHKCRTPCAQQCRPCTAACENRCSHSKCVLKCWQPCAPCLEPCSWKCEHKRCTRLCHEECNREPCDMPCSKRLKCGHQCVGFCGEPCPKLCRVCHSDQLCEIFFGSEEQPDARFVVLEDCGHILEADGMLNWLKSHQKSGLIQLPDCPKCKTPMRKNKRFSAYIKHQMKAIDLIKRKHIADKEKIIEIRDELENDLNLIRSRKRQFKSDEWLKILTDIHETIVKRQESSFAQNDLIGLRNSFKLSMRLREQRSEALDYFTGITARTFLSHVVYEVDKIRPILGVTDMGAMTSDKAEEIWLEVQRIDNLINYYKYRYTFENKPDSWKLGHGDEIKALLDELVQKLIRSNHGYQNNVRVREIFTRLSKIVDLIISDSLRIEIVKAIGVKKGAWFRCPNGHPYCIDRCGGAMQLAYCADCKAPIGGAEHQLLDSNRFAGDFDNSQYPAYSDIANQMENFNINDI